MLLMIMIAFYFLRETGVPVGSMRWHFFFLGAGFMLLETQIVSKMALLFGTTWVVNSVVIAGLLVLIVTANFLVEWWPRISFSAAYLGIFGSILLACIVPLETFFFPSIWIKALAATAVLCLPAVLGLALEEFRISRSQLRQLLVKMEDQPACHDGDLDE